jgi:sarcosine oxidase
MAQLRDRLPGFALSPERFTLKVRATVCQGDQQCGGRMTNDYDVIILGLGAMGSAAAYHLAQRGQRVLGLEQFTPAHDRGSSHGRSRVIRRAYFESPAYVPLLLRAYELWRALELQTGHELLRITGGLMIGHEASAVVSGSIASARLHALAHEVLSATEVRQRFPALLPIDDVALYEPSTGVLFPEECISAHLHLAASLGAELRFELPVSSWHPIQDGVEVAAGGQLYRARRLVVTAGAWAGRMLAGLGLPLRPERNVLFWFDPRSNAMSFRDGDFPVFIWDQPDHAFFGIPDLDGGGVKVGFHHTGIDIDPENQDRTVRDAEEAAIRERLRRYIPELDGPLRSSTVCMYTNTPDEHFAIGLHPELPQVSIAAGFSGHGFKFACVVGEILAGLATTGSTRHPIEPFALNRLKTVPISSLNTP